MTTRIPTQEEFEKFLDWLKTQWFKAEKICRAYPLGTAGPLGESCAYQQVMDYLEQHNFYQPEDDTRDMELNDIDREKIATFFFQRRPL